jgi:hypothetical protein
MTSFDISLQFLVGEQISDSFKWDRTWKRTYDRGCNSSHEHRCKDEDEILAAHDKDLDQWMWGRLGCGRVLPIFLVCFM